MKNIIVAILIASLILVGCVPFVSAASNSKTRPSVKILSIGHSYAWNSIEFLREIGQSQGVDITVAVMYRGNCYLSDHLNYFNNNTRYGEDTNFGFYLKYDNTHPSGHTYDEQYSIGAAVKDEAWDYIMFQEALDYSGSYSVIEKSLPKLKQGVEALVTNPDVKYMWHGLWALEKTEYMPSDKVELKPYNWDQQTMYEAVKATNAQVLASDIGISGLVPTGEAFQLARKSGKYDPTVAGGISLCADSISHANNYGKYLAALVWYMSFTGCKVNKDTLTYPPGVTKEQASELVDFAEQAVTGSGKTLGSVDEVFPSQNDEPTSSNETSSEAIYNPNDYSGGNNSFNPLFLIPIGVAVAAATTGVVIALMKKKKQHV